MRKIIDYIVVQAETERELQDLVSANIKDWGWQPIGGIHTHWYKNCEEDGRQFDFYQAMVRYEEPDNIGCDINGYGQ